MPSSVERSGSDKVNASKTSSTIDALAKLLKASPAAEELAASWSRSHTETLKDDGPRLSDLKQALDSGRRFVVEETPERGLPMWIVVGQLQHESRSFGLDTHNSNSSVQVRTCKASWHNDGTWPLLAADEELDTDASLQGAIRSIHPSAVILRPRDTIKFALPADEGSARRPEASMEEIADAYRRRGIFVEDAVLRTDDW